MALANLAMGDTRLLFDVPMDEEITLPVFALLALLHHPLLEVKEGAAFVLKELAMEAEERKRIHLEDAVVPLVALLREGTAKGKERVTGLLCRQVPEVLTHSLARILAETPNRLLYLCLG